MIAPLLDLDRVSMCTLLALKGIEGEEVGKRIEAGLDPGGSYCLQLVRGIVGREQYGDNGEGTNKAA